MPRASPAPICAIWSSSAPDPPGSRRPCTAPRRGSTCWCWSRIRPADRPARARRSRICAGSGLDFFAQTHKNAPVRTTIDLPEDLFREVKAKAALDGVKLKDLITRYVEQGLRQGREPTGARFRRHRSELPIARAATGRPLPALTNADIHRILDEEDAAGGRPD